MYVHMYIYIYVHIYIYMYMNKHMNDILKIEMPNAIWYGISGPTPSGFAVLVTKIYELFHNEARIGHDLGKLHENPSHYSYIIHQLSGNLHIMWWKTCIYSGWRFPTYWPPHGLKRKVGKASEPGNVESSTWVLCWIFHDLDTKHWHPPCTNHIWEVSQNVGYS